jgi:hypothetical protein
MKHHHQILIVGGLARPIILQRLRLVLPDVAVQWIPTRESDPGSSSFRSAILQEETCLVVVLYGLIRHQHAHDIARLARLHRKRVLPLRRSPNAQRIRQALDGIAEAAR